MRELGFVRCSFGLPPNEEEGDDEGQDYYVAMDEDLKVWLAQRVERVLVDDDSDLEDKYMYIHYNPLQSLTDHCSVCITSYFGAVFGFLTT